MEASVLNNLKDLIEQCKSDPSILKRPELSFFRDYLEWDEEEIDDYEEDDVVESDIELDDSDVVLDIIDYDYHKKLRDLSVEVTEENRIASREPEKRAMEAIAQGKLEVAIEHVTYAILLNPRSEKLYGIRANVYIKMKKPSAAIRDLTRALEINPASAKEYKSRAIAKGMLGKWEEAAKDLHFASKLEYDEESSDLLKKVELNAHKIEEHRRKYDRLRKEREERKIEPLAMPEYAREITLFNKFFNRQDPEMAAVFQDPQIFSQVRDFFLNLDNPVIRAKHESDPKIASILAKFRIRFNIPE